MHVRDLHVTRYGPMAPFEYDGLGAFTVVYGPNEHGKTLLIDALFKLLFKKELKRTRERQFGNMKRVAEQPEGYVVIATHSDEVKLEEGDSISSLFSFDVSPTDFRNVFLIRDSDLRMVDERAYYEAITERLTGLRSSEIDALLGIIQRKGRLRSASADSALVNNADQGKFADRVRDARRVVEQLRELTGELAFERFDELTQELVETRERRRTLEAERERIRTVERRRRFVQAHDAIADLEDIDGRLREIGAADPAILKRWQRLQVEREHLARDVEKGESQIERLRRDYQRAESEVTSARVRADEAERRHGAIEAEFRQRIDEYQHERMEFRRAEPQSGLWRGVLYVSSAVALLALGGYIVTPSTLLVGFGAASLAGVAYGAWSLQRIRRARGDLERRAESMRGDAAGRGIPVESVLDLQSAISDLGREAATLREEARGLESSASALGGEAKRLAERLDGYRRRSAEVDSEIAELASSAGTKSIDDYQTAVDRRRSLEAKRTATIELVRGLLGKEAAAIERVDELAKAVRRGLESAQGDDDESVDTDRGPELDREIETARRLEADIDARHRKGEKRIYNAHARAAELGVLEETPRCRTLHDLDHLADAVEAWCKRIEHEQRVAQEAVRLFLEIDNEERRRVGELFGPDATVSRLFRRITDGRYRKVVYDSEQDMVLVEQADGKLIRATVLSGGAYDQLYLAIRLSIAERLMPESKGFFIMDDPFIKADARRLERLVSTLRSFVDDGWQVLYFTAKREVVDALRGDIESGSARLVELDRSLFAPTWDAGAGAHTPFE